MLPLPAGMFAKWFPWRHILAQTRTDSSAKIVPMEMRFEIFGQAGVGASLSADNAPTPIYACSLRRRLWDYSSGPPATGGSLVIQSLSTLSVLAAKLPEIWAWLTQGAVLS